MALIKEYITDSGIKTTYHRIMSISKEGLNTLKVILHSYTDKTYRVKEQTAEEVAIQRKQTDDKIFELQSLEILTEEQTTELNELINKSVELQPDFSTYFVFDLTVDISMDDVDDISFSNVYETLKKEDIFIDAEND